MARNYRAILAVGAFALSALSSASAQAPQPPGTIPDAGPNSGVCQRLEGQLASIENGGPNAARATQARQYEDALRRQQGELDRVTSRSQRLGCSGGGFFSLFVRQPPECNALGRQIQQMHANIDRLTMEMQRLQGGGGYNSGREEERHNVVAALARNNCGPQYRSAAAREQRGFFESLFGPGTVMAPDQSGIFQSSGTYRTLCVRTCDGYYFPISFSTVPNRFSEDERTCQRMCPAAPVSLYTHRNPGEDIAQATSLSGIMYSELPNAFRYRKEFNFACTCKPAGETWARALGQPDDTVERGDILVTDERAKQMSQPREQRGTKRGADGKPDSRNQPQTGQPALRKGDSGERTTVRSVGPTFLPKP